MFAVFALIAVSSSTSADALIYAQEHLAPCVSWRRATVVEDADELWEPTIVLREGLEHAPCRGLHLEPLHWSEFFKLTGRPELITPPPEAWELPLARWSGAAGFALFTGGLIATILAGAHSSDEDVPVLATGISMMGLGVGATGVGVFFWPSRTQPVGPADMRAMIDAYNERLRSNMAVTASAAPELAVLERRVPPRVLHVIKYSGFTPRHGYGAQATGGAYFEAVGAYRGKEDRPIPRPEYFRLLGREREAEAAEDDFGQALTEILPSVVLASAGYGAMAAGIFSDSRGLTFSGLGLGSAAMFVILHAIMFRSGEVVRDPLIDDVARYNRAVFDEELAKARAVRRDGGDRR